jgi:hypothetical protein
VVTIPPQHNGEIFHPPVPKPVVVISRVLPLRPTIKRFCHDQHTQPVARIEKGWRGWVVRGANGIVSELLQVLHSPLIRAVNAHRT